MAAFTLTLFCFLDVAATMQEPVVKVTGLQGVWFDDVVNLVFPLTSSPVCVCVLYVCA